MLQIPTPETPYSKIKVALNGVSYDFHYRYNFTADYWTLDIYLNDTPIVLGEALLSNSPLMNGTPRVNFQKGILIVFRNNPRVKSKVTLDNLGIGKDYTLYYLDEEDF